MTIFDNLDQKSDTGQHSQFLRCFITVCICQRRCLQKAEWLKARRRLKAFLCLFCWMRQNCSCDARCKFITITSQLLAEWASLLCAQFPKIYVPENIYHSYSCIFLRQVSLFLRTCLAFTLGNINTQECLVFLASHVMA